MSNTDKNEQSRGGNDNLGAAIETGAPIASVGNSVQGNTSGGLFFAALALGNAFRKTGKSTQPTRQAPREPLPGEGHPSPELIGGLTALVGGGFGALMAYTGGDSVSAKQAFMFIAGGAVAPTVPVYAVWKVSEIINNRRSKPSKDI